MSDQATALRSAGSMVERGDDTPGRIGVAHYFAILVQLGLVALLLRQFQIESGAFLRVALLAFAGFAVHAWLPLRHRLPFFVLLSLVALVVALDVANAAWIVALGTGLIAICHAPLSVATRGAMLVAAGALLVAFRAHWVEGPMPDAIWPILGSMFMFRLIVYFYDLRHGAATSPAHAFGYFFMLPNACFPLFPVVDYKTWRRNYFDDDAYRIYQTGVDWMVRGVVQLILYRYIYLHLTLAPSEVSTPSTLTQYLVTNFLLYLRVSGLFHLIVGMLYLFGFRLPETHNRYLLASSFTDFWRRINIYWKDFMQKVFYYPAVFALRKLGTTKAMVIATLYVFVLTWLLHAWQWFWLRGTAFLVWQDVVFWTLLGGLVVVNALWELRHGRTRKLGNARPGGRELAILVAKRFATFWFICVLWSFWTTDSFDDWLSLWAALGGRWDASVLVYPLLVLAVIVAGSIERSSVRNERSTGARNVAPFATTVTVVALVALIGVSIESVHRELGNTVATTVHSLRSGRLSRLDNAKLERGYYENLLSVDRFNSQLWEVYTKRPANWLDIQNAGLKRFTGDFAQTELVPSSVSSSGYGTISTNRWGMRDRDYERVPPAGTFRVAMLGASSVMGWGVGDGETFEALLEARVNEESGTGRRFEILNFGVPGYQPPQQMVAVEKAIEFKPSAVVYIATGREISRAASYLAEAVEKGIDIPFAPLREIVTRAGVVPGSETESMRRLEAHREALLARTYEHVVARAKQAGATPVFVFLPQVREGTWQEETGDTLRIARDAGFAIVDLSEVYRGQQLAAIRVAEWDDHPNRLGHQLIAATLHDRLFARPDAVLAPMRK